MPLPVEILSAPTDKITIFASFVAALLGAGAAFGFTEIERRRRERQRRRELINASIYALTLTLNTLLNFKSQFLSRFNVEFSELLRTLGDIDLGDSASVSSAAKKGHRILMQVNELDSATANAFIAWQEIEFLPLTAAEDLLFTVDKKPDLVRLLITIRTEVNQIAKRIVQRNRVHETVMPKVLAETEQHTIGPTTLLFWQQMLQLRAIVSQHVDVALAIIPVATEQIEQYRKASFRKTLTWLLSEKPETWIGFRVAEKWKPLLPDPANYKDIIAGVD